MQRAVVFHRDGKNEHRSCRITQNSRYFFGHGGIPNLV
jgi:hypothetical protein